MGGGEQNALAPAFGLLEVLESVVTNHVRYVLGGVLGEDGEDGQRPGQVLEHAIDDGLSGRHFRYVSGVPQSNLAQLGNEPVQQPDVESRQRQRRLRR